VIAATRVLGSLTLIVATAIGLLAVEPSSSLPPFAARFLDRPSEPLRAFRAMRHLEATNNRFNARGWMDVLTELSPGTGFTFRVLAEGGSGYVRRRVLRPILEEEQRLVAGSGAASALTTANYAITSEQPAEPGLVRLTVKPLRPEVTLIDGALLVAADDADLVRIEGRLARNPSFWTRQVDVVRRYGRVAGVRVPISMESVALVRIAGRSEMTMTYRYEMVNGQAVAPDDTIAVR
jgi:hypothetical protein